MAIKVLQSSVIANYDVTASGKFHAGDGLIITAGSNAVAGLSATQSTASNFAGFALADHNTTSNTFIQPDPVGSSVVSPDGATFTSYANGFFVGVKRAIGDFQDETAAVVSNLTDTGPTPKRGVGCLKAGGSQFISDRYAAAAVISSPTPLYIVASATIDTGGLLTHDSTTNGVILARSDYFDSTAGLVFATINN